MYSISYWIEEINQKKLMRNKHNIKHLLILISTVTTAQKMKFSINDFFSKCDQIRSKLRIWSRLLKKSFMEDFFFVQRTGWVSISAFSSLVGIPIEITNSALGLKTCVITAEIKRYKSQYFMLLSCNVSVSEWIYTLEFPEYQETPCLFTK